MIRDPIFNLEIIQAHILRSGCYSHINPAFRRGCNYSTLLHELEKYIGDAEYIDLPNQKVLLKSLNISRGKLMKMMRQLYNDFQEKIKQFAGIK